MSQRSLALFSVLLSVGLSFDDDVARRLTGSIEGLELDQGLEPHDQSSNEQRRLLPPYLGAENQPCRNYVPGYPQCDPGLTCSETNLCVRRENKGGEGQQCREIHPRCNDQLCPAETRGYSCVCELPMPGPFGAVCPGDVGAGAPGSAGRRRILPPYFGAENQPCRKYTPGYPRCDPGLTCSETNHGSFATSSCVRRENKGGEGQKCRGSYPRCNDQLCPATRGYSCVCELPMPGPFGAVCPGGAGASGGYRRAELDEDNSSEDALDESSENADDSNEDERRRILPPYLGAENQPCRNYVRGYPQCDPGLSCSETNHGSFSTGICVRREQYGGEGQKCQGWNTCNRGLKPEWSWFPIIECRCARNYRRGLDNSSEDALESSENVLAAPETTRRLGELGFAHIDRQVGLKN